MLFCAPQHHQGIVSQFRRCLFSHHGQSTGRTSSFSESPSVLLLQVQNLRSRIHHLAKDQGGRVLRLHNTVAVMRTPRTNWVAANGTIVTSSRKFVCRFSCNWLHNSGALARKLKRRSGMVLLRLCRSAGFWTSGIGWMKQRPASLLTSCVDSAKMWFIVVSHSQGFLAVVHSSPLLALFSDDRWPCQ